MDLRTIALATLCLLIGGGVVYAFTSGEPDTIRLPGRTDTVTVTETEIDSIIETEVRWRETVTTDTVVVTETRFETDTVEIAVLAPRWYLDEAKIGGRGDTSLYALTWLAGDSAGIRRRRAIERQVTPGPVREIRTDSAGLHVDYGEPVTCRGWQVGGLDLPGWVPVATGAGGGLLLGVTLSP